jgi:hypothetical protein
MLFTDALDLPFESISIATITRTRGHATTDDLAPVYQRAAELGADAVVVQYDARKRPHYLAVHFTSTLRETRTAARADPASSVSGSGGASGCTSGCTVHVRGYTRKDGTYVRPHTRSAPHSGGGGRHH